MMPTVARGCPLRSGRSRPGCGPSAAHAHSSRRLPRSAGRSAPDCRDEPAAGEEDEEGEDRNAKDADDVVLSGHEAYAPGVDEQAGAKHDDACPEATMSERWDCHRGERSRRGMGEAGSPVTAASLPARGRPPEAAARRADLVEVNGAFSVGPPKSAAGRRTVVLPDAVVTTLAQHLAHYTARSPNAFVFLSSQGTHLRRSNFNRRVWQPATRAAGLEGLRVHDLRHTAGTLATAAGGSLREVMQRLGHSTTGAAVRYQHVMADRDAAIARELNRLIVAGP